MTDEKIHISKYGKVFDYLKDPVLRAKEVGDGALEVKGALISGVPFKGIEWKSIRFVDCDFTGSYEIKLKGLKSCLFEGCRFAGLFGLGVATEVRFNKIEVRGESNIYTNKGSTAVLFENSDFRSLSQNPSDWGAVAMEGEARYVNCYAKWFEIAGDKKLEIERCRFDTVRMVKGEVGTSPPVTITDTELLGKTDMVSSHMSSLTMRNCTVGVLDLMDANISGDVTLEKLSGQRINLSVASAGAVAVRNCKLDGPEDDGFSFEIGAYSVDKLSIENCSFGSKPVAIGPGGALPEDLLQVAPRNVSTRLVGCTLSNLDSAFAYSQTTSIEACTLSSADFQNSRIGSLTIEGSRISQKLDLRNTRIQRHSIKDLEPSKLRQVLLEGSTIKQIDL